MLDFMGVEPTKASEGDPPPLTTTTPWLLASPNTKPCSDKPLEELTDEDVMQLTREGCRRYLKDKGMRRPSWNKAQAVQQVLSLRGLCSPTPAGAAALKKRGFYLSPDADHTAVTKSAKLDDAAPSLTMFYAGTVSVFDDVSVDKAYAIMLLAGNVNSWSFPSGKMSVNGVPELPQARKASLHRFLQKRKERFVKEDALTEKSPPSESSKLVPLLESFKVEASSD